MFSRILTFALAACCNILSVHGQCTNPGCKGSSEGTDETIEKILEDHDQKLHDIYQTLLSKIEKNEERFQTIVHQMTEVYLSKKYEVCPPGFQYLPGVEGCFKVLFEKLSWSEAGSECRKLIPGAHLSAVTSDRKQKAISEFLQDEFNKSESSVCIFTDGAQWNGGQLTIWTSGQTNDPKKCGVPYEWKILDNMKIPFNYTHWIILEPSCGHTDEHCAQMVAGDTFRWNDLNCDKKTCALCEL